MAEAAPDHKWNDAERTAYVEAVRAVSTGKRISGSCYLHVSALSSALTTHVDAALRLAGLERDAFDVVRFTENTPKLSLLAYPGFMRIGFPTLAASWTLDLQETTVTPRRYEDHANPPILHRKELMLAADHERRVEFEALTRQATTAGLLKDTAIIGHRLQWREELRARNLRVEGHKLVQRSDDDDDDPIVLRHRTALSRRTLSTPVQALWRHGYLNGNLTFFDYGCGRGDDIAALQSEAVDAAGWDPYYRPDSARKEAEVVNLGFVLNVIESPAERAGALLQAFALCRRVLCVSALIGGRTAHERHRLYGDGVLTLRGTFQKYFTHSELAAYLEQVLGREPVSVAPGAYFVFRTDEAEQAFFANRQRSTRHIVAARPMPRRDGDRTSSLGNPGPRAPRVRQPRLNRWERNADLLEKFWQVCLKVGRLPMAEEFARHDELRDKLGLPKTVLKRLLDMHGAADFREAQRRRRDDVLVYLALGLFERRKSFGAYNPGVQRDIREHWSNLAAALAEAKATLFAMGQVERLEAACREAADAELGVMTGSRLVVRSDVVERLPVVLRVFVGTACRLFGDVSEVDDVKLDCSRGVITLRALDAENGNHPLHWSVVDLRRGSIRFRCPSILE